MSGVHQIAVRVAEAVPVAKAIKRLRLEPINGTNLPEFSGGAHVVLNLEGGGRSFRNPYSLMSSPYDTGAYEVSVLRVAESRGGSAFVHEALHTGAELTISAPTNLFPIDRRARRHLLLAGGIGITPFMAMMIQLDREHADFELHYAMRSANDGAYWGELQQRYSHRVHTYCDDAGQILPLERLLAGQPMGTHLYVCGPAGMIDWVLATAAKAGWPRENVHFERFSAPPSGKAFEIELARSNCRINVGPNQSALEAIEAAGIDPPHLCRGGACGQCETAVLECSGTLEHHDHFLTDQERSSSKKFMICVSRFSGNKLVLDL